MASPSAAWSIEAIDPAAVPGVQSGDIARSGIVSNSSEQSDMVTVIERPALVQFTMVQTGDTGTLTFSWGSGLQNSITHQTGNDFRRYSVEGPCTVSYWCQVTGDINGRLDVETRNGSNPFTSAAMGSGPRRILPVFGGTGWKKVFLELPPGPNDIRLIYTPTPFLGEGNAWLDQSLVHEDQMHPARGLRRLANLRRRTLDHFL